MIFKNIRIINKLKSVMSKKIEYDDGLRKVINEGLKMLKNGDIDRNFIRIGFKLLFSYLTKDYNLDKNDGIPLWEDLTEDQMNSFFNQDILEQLKNQIDLFFRIIPDELVDFALNKWNSSQISLKDGYLEKESNKEMILKIGNLTEIDDENLIAINSTVQNSHQEILDDLGRFPLNFIKGLILEIIYKLGVFEKNFFEQLKNIEDIRPGELFLMRYDENNVLFKTQKDFILSRGIHPGTFKSLKEVIQFVNEHSEKFVENVFIKVMQSYIFENTINRKMEEEIAISDTFQIITDFSKENPDFMKDIKGVPQIMVETRTLRSKDKKREISKPKLNTAQTVKYFGEIFKSLFNKIREDGKIEIVKKQPNKKEEILNEKQNKELTIEDIIGRL